MKMSKYNIFFVALLLVAFQANMQCGENVVDEAWKQRKFNALNMIQRMREEDNKRISAAISNGTLEGVLQQLRSRKTFTTDIGPKANSNGYTFDREHRYSTSGAYACDVEDRQLLAINGMLHPRCGKECLELLRDFGDLPSANPLFHHGCESKHVGAVAVGIYQTTLAHVTASVCNWKKLVDIIKLSPNIFPATQIDELGNTVLGIVNRNLRGVSTSEIVEIVEVYSAMKERDPDMMRKPLGSNQKTAEYYLRNEAKAEICGYTDETCPDYTELMAQLEKRGVL